MVVKMRNTLTIVLVSILLLSFITTICPIKICQAAGDTLHVGSGQTYSTIQAAINAANESDTIYVHSGTYTENIVIDKTLTITGEGSGSTTITGNNTNDHAVRIKGIFTSYLTGVEMSGFTIQNTIAKSNSFADIYIEYSISCTISNCILKNSHYGIYAKQTDQCTISTNTIENNDGTGILLSLYSDDNTIQSNTIQNNNIGMFLQDYSTGNTIKNNNILGHSTNGIWIEVESDDNIIHHNDFDNGAKNAKDEGSNTWDDGSEGNYWDDYTGTDTELDGIGDTAYNIPGGSNQDRYPLGDFVSEGQDPEAEIISISPNPATVGQTVSFNGQGTPDGTISEWEWQSSIDGVLCEHSEDFSSSDLSVGTHTIKFRVKDDTQWSEYATATLIINAQEEEPGDQKPTATIIKPSTSATVTANQGESVEFQGYGTPSEGMIIEYSWRSNKDGNIGTTSAFTKSSLSVGIHIIYFKVRDSNDWSDEVSSDLVILEGSGTEPTNNAPTADAGGPYAGYEGFTIVFNGSGSTDDTTITTYGWDFGDGETGSGYKLSHIYTTSGNYTITLTVTDDSGLSNTDTTTATITSEDNTNNNDDTTNNNDTPGFEIITILLAITILLFSKKKK